MVASVAMTPFTSFFATSFVTAIFSISCDFVICTAISVSCLLVRARHDYNPAQKPRMARSLGLRCGAEQSSPCFGTIDDCRDGLPSLRARGVHAAQPTF